MNNLFPNSLYYKNANSFLCRTNQFKRQMNLSVNYLIASKMLIMFPRHPMQNAKMLGKPSAKDNIEHLKTKNHTLSLIFTYRVPM